MTDAPLLPIFADDGLGSRLLRAAEAYAKDEYIFSPDEGSDHEPTDFEHMLFEDMINGLFAHEPFAAILQEAARAALSPPEPTEGRKLALMLDQRHAACTAAQRPGHEDSAHSFDDAAWGSFDIAARTAWPEISAVLRAMPLQDGRKK